MELKPWPRQVSILAQLTVTIAIIDREMSLGLYYATHTLLKHKLNTTF